MIWEQTERGGKSKYGDSGAGGLLMLAVAVFVGLIYKIAEGM